MKNEIPKMLDKEKIESITSIKPIFQQTIELQHNMLLAIKDVGGSVESFNWKNLNRMSGAELLNSLSANLEISFKPNSVKV